MLSASSIMFKKIMLLILLGLSATSILNAQTENSPYSRYGLGDQLPQTNIMSRGIGGVAAAYADIISVNYLNPASYAKLKRATFDFGLEIDSRTLRVITPPSKFNSVSPTISYVQLGFPLSQKGNWGMNIGLRPVTRINYKVERNGMLTGVDSINTLFEGSGGTYEVYTGTGFGTKYLNIGFNVGYLFGTKDYSTKTTIKSDTTYYYPSQHRTNASFGGLFANAGIQYTLKVSAKNMIRLGAYGSLKREFSARREEIIHTIEETTAGTDSIDVVQRTNESGKIVYPASYGAGLMFYGGDKWLIGADFTQTKWNDYRFFTEKDEVQDSWKFHMGGQILPNVTTAKSYWGRVTYRAGFSYGRDYVKLLDDDDLPTWGVSLGLGLPMRPPSYSNQFSIINTSVEFGQRGNNTNLIRENFMRISVGLTLSDLWFIKRKYD